LLIRVRLLRSVNGLETWNIREDTLELNFAFWWPLYLIGTLIT